MLLCRRAGWRAPRGQVPVGRAMDDRGASVPGGVWHRGARARWVHGVDDVIDERTVMGLLDRLFGGNRGGGQDQPPREAFRTQGPQDTPVSGRGGPGPETGDDAAIQRYRYLLRTAPPEAIEQAHAEAFAALSPEQRRTVLTELGSQVPASERAASDDPQALARMATRAEMRQPGTMERTFSARPGGMGGLGMGGVGMGGVLAGGLLASLAGAFVGTAIANEIFDGDQGNDGGDGNDGGSDQAGGQPGEQGEAQAAGDDGGYGGTGTGDAFGGGDLGSGDFGSGDFGGGGDFGGFDA